MSMPFSDSACLSASGSGSFPMYGLGLESVEALDFADLVADSAALA